jgi:hypothetical protein
MRAHTRSSSDLSLSQFRLTMDMAMAQRARPTRGTRRSWIQDQTVQAMEEDAL